MFILKDKILINWADDIRALSEFKNVSCKISGMVTETNWNNWLPDEFEPYMDVVVESFGIDRVMYGSDWPVCLVSATYKQVYDIVKEYFSGYSSSEQAKVFGESAIKFYNLF